MNSIKGADVEQALTINGDAVTVPTRAVLAVAWAVSGVRRLDQVATLIGVHRNTLRLSAEFEPFRSEWHRLHGHGRKTNQINEVGADQ